ncbi:MAG TPA: sigma-70 family RNA polymerase sigma factor [Gaiellaceae bacterium]
MPVAPTPPLDPESRGWLRELRADGATADAAVARLHVLLLRAASFEVTRRRSALPPGCGDLDALAREAAAGALTEVRAGLDDFRGESRFTTWACKYALREAAVMLRRRAWQGRELPKPAVPDLFAAIEAATLERRELLTTFHEGIERLAPHERDVLVAVAVNCVPIDVLAERLGTTRGSLYRTLQHARSRLRRDVQAAVPAPD